MAWRRIGEITGGGGLASMAERAERSRLVSAAIEEVLPGWLDASALQYQLGSDAALTILAAPGMTRQLRQILPAIKARLAEFGIRRVAIRAGPAAGGH